MQVKDIMTTSVISLHEENTVEEAASVLSRNRISGAPVVNNDMVIVGMVTEHDIIAKHGQTVTDIMTKGVISVSEDTNVEEVTHILVNQHIRRLPVVSKERLVGIISRADIVREIAMRWICQVCGETQRGLQHDEKCPKCGADNKFMLENVPPGM